MVSANLSSIADVYSLTYFFIYSLLQVILINLIQHQAMMMVRL